MVARPRVCLERLALDHSLTIGHPRSIGSDILPGQVDMLVDGVVWLAELNQLVDTHPQDLLQLDINLSSGPQLPYEPIEASAPPSHPCHRQGFVSIACLHACTYVCAKDHAL